MGLELDAREERQRQICCLLYRILFPFYSSALSLNMLNSFLTLYSSLQSEKMQGCFYLDMKNYFRKLCVYHFILINFKYNFQDKVLGMGFSKE